MNSAHSIRSKGFGLKAQLLVAVMALVFSLTSMLFTAPTAADAASATLSVKVTTPTGNPSSPLGIKAGEAIIVSGSGFAPNELIALWLTGPSGTAFDAGSVNAANDGGFSNFPLKGDDKLTIASGFGTWAVTARGVSSKVTIFVNFTVVRPLLVLGTANLGSNISLVVYLGAYWFPNEKVNLWVTFPSGDVAALSYTFADGQGFIPDPTKFGFLVTGPSGVYAVTARGDVSRTPVFANFTL